MSASEVVVFSDGLRLAATLRLPEGGGPHPAVVHCPGWMGLRDAAHYRRYHERLVAAGFAVLAFDYRGFGGSEGWTGAVSLEAQVRDALAATSYLRTRAEIDPARVGILGGGGSGGGVAITAAARDERIACVACLWPIADGRDWLMRARRPEEWRALLERVEANRRRRALGGEDEQVDPLADVSAAPAERAAIGFKKDIADRLPRTVGLSSVESILAFVPEAIVDRLGRRPLLLVGVAEDIVVPTDHVERLYRRAGPPKRLVWLRGTTAYRAHTSHFEEICTELLAWFTSHLRARPPAVVEEG